MGKKLSGVTKIDSIDEAVRTHSSYLGKQTNGYHSLNSYIVHGHHYYKDKKGEVKIQSIYESYYDEEERDRMYDRLIELIILANYKKKLTI
jgi:hypothetical protein